MCVLELNEFPADFASQSVCDKNGGNEAFVLCSRDHFSEYFRCSKSTSARGWELKGKAVVVVGKTITSQKGQKSNKTKKKKETGLK